MKSRYRGVPCRKGANTSYNPHSGIYEPLVPRRRWPIVHTPYLANSCQEREWDQFFGCSNTVVCVWRSPVRHYTLSSRCSPMLAWLLTWNVSVGMLTRWTIRTWLRIRSARCIGFRGTTSALLGCKLSLGLPLRRQIMGSITLVTCPTIPTCPSWRANVFNAYQLEECSTSWRTIRSNVLWGSNRDAIRSISFPVLVTVVLSIRLDRVFDYAQINGSFCDTTRGCHQSSHSRLGCHYRLLPRTYRTGRRGLYEK